MGQAQRRVTEEDKLAARVTDARAHLDALAAVAGHAHELAYSPSGLKYEPNQRLTPRSDPPWGGDPAWKANYADAARAICHADQDLFRTLHTARIHWFPLQHAFVRDRMESPSAGFLLRVIRNCQRALDRLPTDMPAKAARHLDHALEHIRRAHQLLPDTRNPVRRVVVECKLEGCDRTDIKAKGYCHAHYQAHWRKTNGAAA